MNCRSLSQDFLHDEAGFIISAELVLISTTVVLGLVVGLVCVRDAVVSELSDVGAAINTLNQSYCYSGMHARKSFLCGYKSSTAGSSFFDQLDGSEQARADFDYPCAPAVPVTPLPVQPAPAPAPAPAPVPKIVPQPVPAPVIECPPIPVPTLAPVMDCPPVSESPCPSPCPAPVVECPPPAVFPVPPVNSCPPAAPAPVVW